jgi:hypothetical protein
VLDEINSCPTGHEGGTFLCKFVKELRRKALDQLEEVNQGKQELSRLHTLTAQFEKLELCTSGAGDESAVLQRHCSALKARIVKMDAELRQQSERLQGMESERAALMRLLPSNPAVSSSSLSSSSGEVSLTLSLKPKRIQDLSRSDLIRLSERTLLAEKEAKELTAKMKEMTATLESAKKECEQLHERLIHIEGKQTARQLESDISTETQPSLSVRDSSSRLPPLQEAAGEEGPDIELETGREAASTESSSPPPLTSSKQRRTTSGRRMRPPSSQQSTLSSAPGSRPRTGATRERGGSFSAVRSSGSTSAVSRQTATTATTANRISTPEPVVVVTTTAEPDASSSVTIGKGGGSGGIEIPSLEITPLGVTRKGRSVLRDIAPQTKPVSLQVDSAAV